MPILATLKVLFMSDYITVSIREETYERFEEAQEERFNTTRIPNTEAFEVILEEYSEFRGGIDE